MSGYHLRKIAKGRLGEISKMREELEEWLDAREQGCALMELHELSDFCGAAEFFAQANGGAAAWARVWERAQELAGRPGCCAGEWEAASEGVGRMQSAWDHGGAEWEQGCAQALSAAIRRAADWMMGPQDLMKMASLTRRAFESGHRA